jgi:hypothetical protein
MQKYLVVANVFISTEGRMQTTKSFIMVTRDELRASAAFRELKTAIEEIRDRYPEEEL